VVIAIDGPGGVGKSTVARRVASSRGLAYLDTGATYRAAALAALGMGADLADTAAVIEAVAAATIEYSNGSIFLDGEDVSAAIRTPEATAASSAVAAIPEVREIVVAMQRAWVETRTGKAVVEGRDIGTVVFPAAALKIFLTARPEVRAARRAGDPEADGAAVTEIRDALDKRDHADSTRNVSPLRPAPDALVIDTSDMPLDAVIARVLAEADLRSDRPRLL
jgi:cytidylate kinase